MRLVPVLFSASKGRVSGNFRQKRGRDFPKQLAGVQANFEGLFHYLWGGSLLSGWFCGKMNVGSHLPEEYERLWSGAATCGKGGCNKRFFHAVLQ